LLTAVEVIVRDLRPDDWAEVAEIYRDGMRSGLATFEIEVPSWEDWHTAQTIALVAENELGTVIGWAALGPVSTRWAYRGVAESSVYVAREAQGRGIGRVLMERLIERSDRDGIWTIQTSVFPENNASLKLHRSVGFRVVGVRERIGKRDGLWRDTVLMERRSTEVN